MRAAESTTRIHYRSPTSSVSFILFASSPTAVQSWRSDKTIPLVDVVASFKIFTTSHTGGGGKGVMDEAGRLELENEFGTADETTVVKRILEEGEVGSQKSREREGNTVCAAIPVGGVCGIPKEFS